MALLCCRLFSCIYLWVDSVNDPLAAVVLLAASEPTGCIFLYPSAIVYGYVTVLMVARWQVFRFMSTRTRPTAVSIALPERISSPRSDARGYYRSQLISLLSPTDATCFIIYANRTNDPRWPSDSAIVRAQIGFAAAGRLDSLRLDLAVDTISASDQKATKRSRPSSTFTQSRTWLPRGLLLTPRGPKWYTRVRTRQLTSG
jgi:hypothetical protein